MISGYAVWSVGKELEKKTSYRRESQKASKDENIRHKPLNVSWNDLFVQTNPFEPDVKYGK